MPLCKLYRQCSKLKRHFLEPRRQFGLKTGKFDKKDADKSKLTNKPYQTKEIQRNTPISHFISTFQLKAIFNGVIHQ